MEDKAAVHIPPARRGLIVMLVMGATLMVVLDQTIANVALPHMQAALGATPDTIAWVLTSYILATAVAMPMTGWLSGRFGRKALFSVAIIGFTVSSALCGLSGSLPMMVAARVLQGFFGAFLIPLSQSFMYDMHAPSAQVRAVTIWGMGVMIAPILGPVLGGYLTDAFDWRWVFFINVPIGLVSGIGTILLMPAFPGERRPLDRSGFLLILVALCALQLMLDRGTQEDWFESPEIIIEAGVSIAAFWMLIFHLRHTKHPIIPAALFINRNFMASLVLSFVISPILVAGSALLPPLLQVLLHYPVYEAGLIMIPRGVAMMVAMMVGSRLLAWLDGRILILAGLIMIALSLHMQTRFTLDMGQDLIIWSGLLQGAGMGLALATINLLAVSSLSIMLRTDGAAVYNLTRNIGASLAIAFVSALLARNVQINHEEIGGSLTVFRLPFLIPGFAESFGAGSAAGLAIADAEVTRQAMMIAYIDDFWVMMWATIAVIPVLLFIDPVRPSKGEPVMVSE